MRIPDGEQTHLGNLILKGVIFMGIVFQRKMRSRLECLGRRLGAVGPRAVTAVVRDSRAVPAGPPASCRPNSRAAALGRWAGPAHVY